LVLKELKDMLLIKRVRMNYECHAIIVGLPYTAAPNTRDWTALPYLSCSQGPCLYQRHFSLKGGYYKQKLKELVNN
jgi:hypothetical protein